MILSLALALLISVIWFFLTIAFIHFLFVSVSPFWNFACDPYLAAFTDAPCGAQLLSAMSALAEQSLPSQLAVLNEWLATLLAQPLHFVSASSSTSASASTPHSTGLLTLPDPHAPSAGASAGSSALSAGNHSTPAPADLATIREHRPGYAVVFCLQLPDMCFA